MTLLPAAAREALTGHLADVRRLNETNLACGFGRVVLPFALDRKSPKPATGAVRSRRLCAGVGDLVHSRFICASALALPWKCSSHRY